MEFATGAMGSLLAKLGELLKDEYKLQKGVRKDVEYLKRELASIHTALRKVGEVPPEQLDEQVKVWAREVRELSYDMEDVVDTFMVRVDQDSSKGLIKHMVKLFKKGRTRRQIANEIQDIKVRVQEVADRSNRNKVDDVAANPAAATTVDPRLSALYNKVTDLVGIDEAREELIKRLTERDDASKQQLKIVSVVGFGGMGKTTIANQVYQNLKMQFDCGAFVSISRSPDTKKVLRDILLDVDKEECKDPTFALWDERQLINELQKSLEHKRYLVVIDDIWDISVWTKMIRCALPDNNLENRIITTTRDLDVANQLGGAYKLQPLSDANSKKLFYGRLFSGECLDDQLREVSDKILRKCGGVPLAIVTIASLLNSKMKNTREWNKVHDSIGCGHLDGPDMKDMRMILSLSYYSLPPNLRTCLLYMSIFPEDYEIKKVQLIWLWIAEGFIQYGKQGETPYELGEYYFNELINRSLIQPGYIDFNGRVEAWRVHDMVLDLIRSLSNEENFVTVLDGAEQNTSSQRNVHRLSIQNTSKMEHTVSHDAMTITQALRSLTIFSSPAINLRLPPSRFCSLRVLELRGCHVGEVCHLNLGNLLQLRYLGLRGTDIHQLPGDIGKLQFLQTLDLGENFIPELPSTIVQLRQLMCLHVDYRTRLPDGIGNLASLEVLSGIPNVYNSPDLVNFVKELRKLTGLRELKMTVDPEDSLLVDLAESLCNLPKIHTLEIYFHLGCMDRFGELWVPPQRLRSLWFTGLGNFSTMPACIERNLTHLSDLSSLYIQFKRLRQEEMQILARLPALCSLWIWGRTHERLIIGAHGFHCLRKFTCHSETPMFQQGAMPRVESVFFTLHVRTIKDDGSDGFETGLGNLLSLEDVEVHLLNRGEASYGEVKEAEAALSHAADVNPNSPTLRILVRESIPFHYSC